MQHDRVTNMLQAKQQKHIDRPKQLKGCELWLNNIRSRLNIYILIAHSSGDFKNPLKSEQSKQACRDKSVFFLFLIYILLYSNVSSTVLRNNRITDFLYKYIYSDKIRENPNSKDGIRNKPNGGKRNMLPFVGAMRYHRSKNSNLLFLYYAILVQEVGFGPPLNIGMG